MLAKYKNKNKIKISSFKIKGKKSAFTLAEVLITLTVIGVLAAITIPSLLQNVNKVGYVAKLQKEYAVLQQAYKMIIADAGGSILNSSAFIGASVGDSTMANAFAAKLNARFCDNDDGCWYHSSIKYLGGNNEFNDVETQMNGGKLLLADGTSMKVSAISNNCNRTDGAAGTPLDQSECAWIWLDINGAAGPNTQGRDVFRFWVTQTGIYPFGSYGDGMACNINGNDWTTSDGCPAKVLKEGAMNY